MKSFNDFLKETTAPARSADEKRFKDKHVIDKKEHPVADESQFTAKTTKKKRVADLDDDKAVYEENDDDGEVSSKGADGDRMIECPDCGAKYKKGDEHECDLEEESMSDAQKKKREEIVLSMKKKMGEFKSKYGDKAQDVMYATATKMAMKEEIEELDENKAIIKVYQDMKAQGKKDHNILDYIGSMPKYKKVSRDQMAKIIGDAKRKGIFKEDTDLQEAVIDTLNSIVKKKQMQTVKFADGTKTKVDMTTANAMVKVHDALNSQNQKKFADAINKNETMFMKMMDFAFSGGKK